MEADACEEPTKMAYLTITLTRDGHAPYRYVL